MMKSLRSQLLLFFVLFSVAAFGFGQSFRGALRGTVKDASGAAVPGAALSATSLQTGQSRKVVSSSDGSFAINELPAGDYELVASTTGLAPVKYRTRVDVGADTTLEIVLGKVAQVSQTIDITEEAPLLDPSSTTLSQVIENKLVVDLPLNGRDFGKLVALTPGVAVEGSGVAGTEKGFGQFNINGNRDRSNNYLLDGTDNNDPFFNNSALNQVGITGAPASLLPIDAIEEFNLQTQATAEYGRNSGATVNILTKSGGNQFHGSAFEYLRNSALDARNYFNVAQNQDGSSNAKSPFKNNQFGASLGGPIVHQRTFFFGAYEGQRERVSSDFLLAVPTANQIASAQAITLANQGYVNPALVNLLNKYFPKPTTVDSNGLGWASYATQDKNDLNSAILKIDHRFDERNSFTARYAYSGSEQHYPLGGTGYGAGSRIGDFAQVSPTRVQVFSASLLTAFSPAKVNELRFGYSRYRTSFKGADATLDPASLGLDMGTGKTGLPEIDFNGVLENFGASAYSIPRGRVSQTFQGIDHFTWTLGRHVVKIGGEFHHVAVNGFNDNEERGLLYVSGSDSGTGDPVVDTLYGYLTGNVYGEAYTGSTQRTTLNNGASVFAQDEFKAAHNLTVNYGVRWEYYGPLSEKHNLLSNLGSDGLLHMVGSGGVNSAWDRKLDNFSPRLGLAWQLHPKTVLHAGYGLYYDYIPQNVITSNYTSVAGITTNPIGPKPVLPLNFDSTAWTTGSGVLFTPATEGPYNIFVTSRNFTTPYVQSWNFNIQQELSKTASLEIGYVGSKGTHLTRLYDANQDGTNENYYSIDTLGTNSASSYHALQATLKSRNWHGLTGFANYTWGKSLDDASDAIDFTAGAAMPQDSDNLRAEKGPSTFDTRQRFTAAANYTLPTLGFAPRALKSGWQLGAIVTAQSGRPIPIVTADGGINYRQRPDLIPGVNPINAHWTPATGYLNPAAFAQPSGEFGNLGRNAIYGPKFVNTDFSIEKRTKLTEKVDAQLRAEFFNIFNHPNFALPAGTFDPTSPVFGVITQTPDVAQGNPGLGGGGPRVLQLALRLEF